MKIIEEFELDMETPSRFEVTARTSNQLLLRDNEMKKLYRIDVAAVDWAQIVDWGDNQWWNFIYIEEDRSL